MATSKTLETKKAYASRAEMLRRQAAKQYGIEIPSQVPMTLVVEHLLAKKDRLAANTWRQYRAALSYAIEQELSITPDTVELEELQAAHRQLARESGYGTNKKGNSTSSNKLKSIKQNDFDIISDYLRSQIGNHQYALALLTWMQAGEATGLRPSEWESAQIIELDGHTALKIENAKHTNGRGNGSHRHLILDALEPEKINAIKDMIFMLDGFSREMSFKSFYDGVRSYNYSAVRTALGKRSKYPTLYTYRHQFTANCKASNLSRKEVAALLGQASDATAPLHYGRKQQGRKGATKVKPLAREVETVREKHNQFNIAEYKKVSGIKK